MESIENGHLLFSRRRFLAGASGAILLAGCSARNPVQQVHPVHTVDGLLAEAVFYVAHRGSMDNWPEHTADAYTQSLAAGAKAIEISLSATADGELVCHHDLNTLRMTGVDRVIAETKFDGLRSLQNNARQWLGPNSFLLPIPRLQDVLDSHAAHSVIFIEDKQGTNTAALLDLMDSYPDSTQHFVWKQPALVDVPDEVTRRGYKTWGYLPADDFGVLEEGLERLVSRYDLLGIHHSAPDDLIRTLVQGGIPVMVWEVHTRSMRDRLVGLGVRGMMCSNIPYVTTSSARSRADIFATGLRGHGDLPWALAWTHQPEIISSGSSILLAHSDKASYCMGSLCPVPTSNYSINFEMRWPETLPRDRDHAGVAFGQRDDSPYRVRAPADSGGYHLIIRRDGELVLFGRVAGEVDGYPLGRVLTLPPVVGEWMRFRIEVTSSTLRCVRLDDGSGTVTARTDVYRGGYFSLCRNYWEYPPVEFRGVSVT
ncbi:glycerophosphodiester phosphodiesterase family protein [Arthrobacter sp. CAN_C5]|uniref:glycerophosphodiester phosphodiesterase n=1 Tax=Arthrobacter sp. CAN_C5 TaxID=2760706 RepID=UPI001AE542BB|nr:glycerophosphodiester phosphodiesterase family protein [Arthrobacter sp. CAN_C5]MBP2217732.1 glycerophosphoryl diester phosphodiesterase [Arthrobacter sp. CAN_C5]